MKVKELIETVVDESKRGMDPVLTPEGTSGAYMMFNLNH